MNLRERLRGVQYMPSSSFLRVCKTRSLDAGLSTMAARLARLKPETTVFFICDVQEKFRAGIHKFATVVTGCQRMVRAAQELKIPVIATEQYPKGLGHTVEEIDTSHELTTVVAKTDFSMIVPEVVAKLDGLNRTDAVILGLEAHVCVQQSTLDLINMGYNVHLCVDAVSSQTTTDRSCGLHRAAGAGALLTTTESVLFELIRSKDHPSFKAISTTVKELKASDPLGFM